MDEIIQLTCPACGGKLNVGANATLLTCQHCGTESTVRREGGSVMLESFGRCPCCGRNDRVEKVSSIINLQTQNISSNEMQFRIVPDQFGKPVYQRVAVPKTITQSSELANKLSPPPQPIPTPRPLPKYASKRKANTPLIFGLIILIPSGFTWLFLILGVLGFESLGLVIENTFYLACVLPMILSTAIGIMLTFVGMINAGKIKRMYLKSLEVADQENRAAFENWQKKNDEIISKWQDMMTKWESLHYCHRDDCVFIPEEGSSAPLSKMREFIEGAIAN